MCDLLFCLKYRVIKRHRDLLFSVTAGLGHAEARSLEFNPGLLSCRAVGSRDLLLPSMCNVTGSWELK